MNTQIPDSQHKFMNGGTSCSLPREEAAGTMTFVPANKINRESLQKADQDYKEASKDVSDRSQDSQTDGTILQNN